VPVNDPLISGIMDRIRSLLVHEPAQTLDVLAATLHLERDAFQKLVNDRESIVDAALLIDVIAALVREFGVDPEWLLTGRYNVSIHREALALGADRSEDGARAMQLFIGQQYRKLRDGISLLALPPVEPC
jgi:plasmid maintenance system antidote protein VapI